MLTKEQVLSTLDNCDEREPFNFINLGHPYVYLIDSRLNIFRNNNDRWAVVSEVLGCNTRGYAVTLEIRYFGNCLINLEDEEGEVSNHYNVLPFDRDNFNDTIDDVTQSLKADAKFWIVRGVQIPLSHNKQDYLDAGIELKEYEPNEISGEEVARLVVQKKRNLFRATDDELYKSIPKDLNKILVIDEWHHKEFHQSKSPFEKAEFLTRFDLNNPSVKEMVEKELEESKNWNLKEWESRPSSYETWQQIADIIVTGDTSYYKPTLEPNSHWKIWAEGGSM